MGKYTYSSVRFSCISLILLISFGCYDYDTYSGSRYGTPIGSSSSNRLSLSEIPLSKDKWQIEVTSRGRTPTNKVKEALLIRAAELTLKNNYTHFVLGIPKKERAATKPREKVIYVTESPVVYIDDPLIFEDDCFFYDGDPYFYYDDPFLYPTHDVIVYDSMREVSPREITSALVNMFKLGDSNLEKALDANKILDHYDNPDRGF